MPTLTELFALEAGPKGRVLSIADVQRDFPEAFPPWDQIQSVAGKNTSFRVGDDGMLTAQVSSGGGNWQFDGKQWNQVEKPGSSGEHPFRSGYGGLTGDAQNLLDKFSKTPEEYDRNIRSLMARIAGSAWERSIESLYGPGSVKKILKGLWDTFHTDYEGANEMIHWWDVSQRTIEGQQRSRKGLPTGVSGYSTMTRQEALGNYPLRIGPRFDVPIGQNDVDGAPWEHPEQYTRTQRITDPSYFNGLMYSVS